jgi:hypothetical protein
MTRLSGDMVRRLGSGAAVLLSLAGAVVGAAPAHAMEVSCIEASRYKHIYRIFGNDRKRFAAYFGVDARNLPGPEVCRAVVVTGAIDARRENADDNDFTRLLRLIRESDGWLATLYLVSPGGNIAMGLRLGELTRMFWLNTTAIEDRGVEYVPDFVIAAGPGSSANRIPPDLEQGWRDYIADTKSATRVLPVDSRARRCASACTFIAAAGIYRLGKSYFHRGHREERPGAAKESSMTDVVEGLQKAEARVIAFYRKMDSGQAAIETFQSTASETVLAAEMSLMPRYVADYLKKKCLTQNPPSRVPSSGAPAQDAERPRGSSWKSHSFPESEADLQCIAATNTHERLTQYAKLCQNDCDQRKLYHETTERMRALLPDDKVVPNRSEERPRRGGSSGERGGR